MSYPDTEKLARISAAAGRPVGYGRASQPFVLIDPPISADTYRRFIRGDFASARTRPLTFAMIEHSARHSRLNPICGFRCECQGGHDANGAPL